MTSLIVGSLITLSATFTRSGVPSFNPTTVILLIRRPDGVIDSPSVTSAGAGKFFCEYLTVVPGVHYYSYRSTAANEEAISSGRFVVLPSAVTGP